MADRREAARLLIAAVAAFVALLAFTYIFRGDVGALVAGIAAGTIAGTAASSRLSAAVAAIAAALATTLLVSAASASFDPALTLANVRGGLLWGLVLVAASAAAALAVRLLIDGFGRRISLWLLVACVALAVLGAWPLALRAAALPDPLGTRPSMASWLTTVPDMTQKRDADLYLREYQLVASGRNYYDAVVAARLEADPGTPVDMRGAIRFRMPTLFWLWAVSPFPRLVTFTGGLLLLGSVAAFAAFALGRRIGHPSLAAATAACVAAYFAAYASKTMVTFSEPWAGGLLVICAAAWALHLARKGDVAWLVTSVVAGLLAALVRELAVFGLVAGLVASLVVKRPERRAALLLWGSALVVFIGAYTAHVVRLGGALFGGGTQLSSWTSLSADRLLIVASQGDRFLLGLEWLSLVFVLLTVGGVFVSRPRAWRWFALVAAVLPLVAFSLVGPRGSLAVGQPEVALGYWGILIKPLLWAMLPAAAYLLFRRRASGASPGIE